MSRIEPAEARQDLRRQGPYRRKPAAPIVASREGVVSWEGLGANTPAVQATNLSTLTDVIAAEIVENLEAALAEFAEIATALGAGEPVDE